MADCPDRPHVPPGEDENPLLPTRLGPTWPRSVADLTHPGFTAKDGYSAHPLVDLQRGEINGRRRMLGPLAIDYVAAVRNVTVEQAGLDLKDAMFDGCLRAEGPLGKISLDFWRYAAISPDGRAFSPRTMQQQDWFELDAAAVLDWLPPPAEWSKAPQLIVEPPPDVAGAEPVVERPPTKTPRRRKNIDEAEIKQWISKQEAHARATEVKWSWPKFIKLCESARDEGGLYCDQKIARSLWDRLDLDVRQPTGRPRKTPQRKHCKLCK